MVIPVTIKDAVVLIQMVIRISSNRVPTQRVTLIVAANPVG